MVLGMDSATCVSSQQFDSTTIQSVKAIIGAVQGQTTDEMKVKEPETVKEELEQPKGDPDLEQAMEVLKEKQEQKNLLLPPSKQRLKLMMRIIKLKLKQRMRLMILKH